MNLQEVYQRLNLTEDCLIRMSDPNWKDKVSFPSRLLHLLDNNDILKTIDAFFCFDNKPLIVFFAGCGNKEALHKAIWNLNEVPIVIIIENNAVEIYNGFSLNKETGLLESIGKEKELTDFSYFELVTGKTWEKYQKELSHKNRVDYHLLANIEAAQEKLNKDGIEQNVANALLGKIIFIRYLIDRQVRLNFQNKKEYWTNEKLCELLKSKSDFWKFIQYLENSQTGFNGDMFKISQEEYDTIKEQSLHLLIRLLQGEEIATGQQSLFELYDFSILPIEFISNVYEKFIGKENQDKKGAYYTPTFLVDYIISETVGKKLKESSDFNCKVLDPACGSGIFLVESLRRIIEKYITVNNISHTDTDEFREALRTLAKDNIFGIDEDENAIQVAVFSVYLTLLDYQKPADIEKFKFPKLIGSNFICSDTFDVDNKDLKKLEEKKLHFDFIIGNPPWKRGGVKKGSCCEAYLKKRRLLDILGNREIAQAFVLRSMDFTNSDTQCALVLVSKILYNLEGKKFRSFILDKLFIQQVFELAPVRKEVFNKSNDPAIAPACILFYKNANEESTNNNVITHIAIKPSRFFSMFKVFSLTRTDIQEVQQDRLKENDWLWKVLVYGSYLDFIFIDRLKKRSNVKDILQKEKFLVKQGLKVKDGKKQIDVSCLLNWDYIKTQNVGRYIIVPSKNRWVISPVGYVYRNTQKEVITDIYKAPVLLIAGGIPNDLRAVSAISYSDGVYKSSLTGIKGNGENSLLILKNIQGILSSSLFAYYNLMSFSSSGIEREETHDEEKLEVPYCPNISDAVKEMEDLTKEKYSSTLNDTALDSKISAQEKKIDKLIFQEFKCSKSELDLIDYAINISVPIAVKPKGYEKIFSAIKKNDSLLIDYAKVYLDRFSNSFNRNGKRFIVEIQYSQQIIGMFFKIIDENDYHKDVVFTETNDNLLPLIIRLSSERITEQLFVQKDVRGFEKEYFYIFKPNEKRLWHKAIAHLDVNEFDDAMLRAGGPSNE